MVATNIDYDEFVFTGECEDDEYLPYNASAYPWDEVNTTGKWLSLDPMYGERLFASSAPYLHASGEF